uniref:CUB-like domain-containing protein n=1 Tax=Plectus sambesii TaxID=2011161 RepID=A0A914XP68_9BILA
MGDNSVIVSDFAYYRGFSASVTMVPAPTTQILHTLSTDRPFHLIQSSDLVPPSASYNGSNLWTVSAQAQAGSQYQVQLSITFDNLRMAEFVVIDGVNRDGNVIFASNNGWGFTTTKWPITSKTGSLTIFFDDDTNLLNTDYNFVFAQLNTDTQNSCSPYQMVYMTDRMTMQKQTISLYNNGNKPCAVALVGTSNTIATLFETNYLVGGMSLSGGVEFGPTDHNEIAIFSTPKDVTPSLTVKGKIFVVSLVAYAYTTVAYMPINPNTDLPKLAPGSKDLLMSSNFPLKNTKEVSEQYSFQSLNDNNVEVSLNIVNYDLGDRGTLTIQSLNTGFTKIITNSGSNMTVTFITNSFQISYKSNGVQQKGFALWYTIGEYKVDKVNSASHSSRGAWFWIMIAAIICVVILALILLIFLCHKRKKGVRRGQRQQTVIPPATGILCITPEPKETVIPTAPPSYEQSTTNPSAQPNFLYPSLYNGGREAQ